MSTVAEEDLQATGLPERTLATYRAAGSFTLPLSKRKKLAKKLGVVETTVKRHLSQVRQRLDNPSVVQPTVPGEATLLEVADPERYAEALSKLADPLQSVAAVAREMGMGPMTAAKIAKDLDGEMQPLGRAIEDIRLEDLKNRFGTLSRDAMDAITPEKLSKANAQQLAIIAGIGVQNWQLLRGQPTSRMEIGDRRQMNELVTLIMTEAKRRGVEIDVTPDGDVQTKKSPYRNAAHQRDVKQIASGDPAETLVPA